MHVVDAIILKKGPAGEADCMVTALTSRFARIRLVAQGARKVEAKLKGHLEPLSLSRLSFVVGKNGYRLIGAELLDFFQNIKTDPDRIRMTAEMIQLLDCALFEDTSGQNSAFFTLGLDTLSALNDTSRTNDECEQALLLFKAQFLKELGLLPTIKNSVNLEKIVNTHIDKIV